MGRIFTKNHVTGTQRPGSDRPDSLFSGSVVMEQGQEPHYFAGTETTAQIMYYIFSFVICTVLKKGGVGAGPASKFCRSAKLSKIIVAQKKCFCHK
jgi:hypothetical protein